MHAAPPVRMAIVPDDAWQLFVALCIGIAVGNLVAWVAQLAQVAFVFLAVASLAATLATVVLSRVVLRRGDQGGGVLLWDGASWVWSTGTEPTLTGEAQVMVDLGSWLLLRIRPVEMARPAVWLAMSRRSIGAAWPAARAALYARGLGLEPALAPPS